ncbi:MAG: RsiW-degrading membrane proteinase PrsW (M82 family) [Candidatus Paceibacteria bacterium]|jgi:RsiW-degrading membrane proteinase PrsW (M82 family)
MTPTLTLTLSFIGGITPAVIWLFFWLREDEKHPEPGRLIFLTFFFGILMVPLAFILEYVVDFLFIETSIESEVALLSLTSFIVIILWASIEEILKYFAAKKGGLDKKANNEPIDPIIYLITAALGFSAGENVLFLINPLIDGSLANAFIVTNMRFIGATLLHVGASAIIGLCLSFSYFNNKRTRKEYLLTGIILSIMLHTIFNFFIISTNVSVLLAFSIVWILIVSIILLFEKVKKIHLNKIK